MKRWIKFLFFVGIPICILVIFGLSYYFGISPRLKLNGKDKIELNLNDKYDEKGVIAKNLFGNTKFKVKVKGKVNTNKVGTYKLEYYVKSGILTKKIYRIVEVKDKIPPTITLTEGNEINVCPGTEYVEQGYSATDNYDGDLTDKVEIIKGKDFIKYKVKDSSNNTTVVERKLIYCDKDAPILELKGKENMRITKYSKYLESGYTATDNCDGDLTANVSVTGSVDTTKEGTYILTYSVSDKEGNITTKTRTVKVYIPSTFYNPQYQNSTIYLTFDDGPSASITPKVLDILKEEGVKATFFVINHNDSLNYLIKRAYDEGHTIALHSYTHKYNLVYSSIDAYFNDLTAIENKVKNITGGTHKIIRFPGGSSNTISKNYNIGIMSNLVRETANRGYIYYDWNVSAGDAGGGAKSSSDVYNNVIKGLSYNKTNIVLMHDLENNYMTLNALRDIIIYGKNNGYKFAAIDNTTPQVKQKVAN